MVSECNHVGDFVRQHDYLKPDSKSLVVLSTILTGEGFLKDIGKVSANNATSIVENFNSESILYRPKRYYL